MATKTLDDLAVEASPAGADEIYLATDTRTQDKRATLDAVKASFLDEGTIYGAPSSLVLTAATPATLLGQSKDVTKAQTFSMDETTGLISFSAAGQYLLQFSFMTEIVGTAPSNLEVYARANRNISGGGNQYWPAAKCGVFSGDTYLSVDGVVRVPNISLSDILSVELISDTTILTSPYNTFIKVTKVP